MKVLLWKEFYEKRLWGLLWAISIILPLGTQANLCSGNLFTSWILLPVMLSFVVGASAYSAELKENRVDFIYSQPISWTKLLLAKALFGLAVTLGSCVLAAIVFRIICPDYYLDFATPSRLVHIVGLTAWWLWTLYMTGLFFSVVLPGVMGSLSVFILCLLPLAVTSMVAYEYLPTRVMDMFELGKSFAMFIGPGIAALMILRFGLTLPQRTRAIRYGVVVLLVSVVVPMLFVMFPKDAFVSAFCDKNCDWSSISPKGDYALVHYRWRFQQQTGIIVDSYNLRERFCMTRLRDGKTVPIGFDLPRDTQHFWADSGTVYFHSPDTAEIRILRMTSNGRLITQSVKIAGSQSSILPSPDGKLAILASQGSKGATLEFLDTRKAQKLDAVTNEATAYWWQSKRQVAYLDSSGKQHTLDL